MTYGRSCGIAWHTHMLNWRCLHTALQGARNPTSILFAAAGTRGMQAPHALMSCSSKGQRSKMQAGGLTFTMPLAPKEASPAVQGAAVQQAGSTKGGAEGEGADGMQPQQQQAQRGVAGVRDHSPQSLLLFTGSRAVHMLFDWLLSETSFQAQSIGEAAQDVPMILAPLPFEGATLRKPLVKVSTDMPVVRASSVGPGVCGNCHQ